MRVVLTRVLRRLLRIFFRTIEVVGLENVPVEQPVIFAVNHPNGLVDPLFILCFAPRGVSFLAKAPLLTMPILGYFVRTLDSIPVYRKQDNTSGSNEETFSRARETLRKGGSIAIFPEGTTHSDTKLREFKTGAARIALGAALPSLAIVPAGIYYTEKQTFRSRALVVFGDPIPVTPGPPDPEPVHALTGEIERALSALTLQAESRAALDLIAQAEDIFTSDPEQPLAEELELRKRFVDGYRFMRERDPQRLARLEAEIRRFEAELDRYDLEPHELRPRFDGGTIASVLLLFPVALIGAVIHFIPYRIVHALAKRFSRGANEMVATVKFVAALAIYPLMWIAIAVAAGLWWGAAAGAASLVLVPLLGYAALRVLEELDEAIGRSRAFVHRLTRRDAHARLLERRRAIRSEIVAVDDELRRV